jgi:protein gp37
MAKAAAWPDLRGAPRPDKPWIPPEMPRLIFVGDMGDIMSGAVPFEYLREELVAAADSPKGRRHVWLWLTKRPGRLAEFAAWNGGLPGNVWAGTSITGEASLSRAEQLWKVPAGLRFLSVEPQIETITFGPYLGLEAPDGGKVRPIISLVINGGESHQQTQRARHFNLRWARENRDACKLAGVAFFMKQLGARPVDGRIGIDGPASHAVTLDLVDSHGGNWSEWPADLRIRELPTAAGVAS